MKVQNRIPHPKRKFLLYVVNSIDYKPGNGIIDKLATYQNMAHRPGVANSNK